MGNLKWTIALVYLDDVVIFSPDFDTHAQHLQLVLQALRQANLKLKPKKCTIASHKLLYLGHMVSKEGIEMHPEKTRAIRDFPTPTKLKNVQSFVSLCSYYRRFVPEFSKIARPLTRLSEKGVPFVWSDEVEEAFQTLKGKLMSHPILGYPDDNAETLIHSDASTVGIGATLVQIQKRVERVIAYASRSLSKTERNYSVTNLECLAVVFAIKRFRPYVYGKKFKVVVDHCALCHLLKLKDPNGQLARWTYELQPYDFEIVYKNGRKHLDADGLSRNPVDPPESDEESYNGDLRAIIPDADLNIQKLCALQDWIDYRRFTKSR